MTNEQAIARIAEKLKTARRNKDGSLNGNVLAGYGESLKNILKANGADHNDACRQSYRIMDQLKAEVV